MNTYRKNDNFATLYHGDCLELLKTLPQESVNCCIFDLPYGTTKHKWDIAIDATELHKELTRICNPLTPVVNFCKQPFSSQLIAKSPFVYKHQWIWDKSTAGNFAFVRHQPLQSHEEICVFGLNKGTINYFPVMTKGKIHKRGSCSPEDAMENPYINPRTGTMNGRGFNGVKRIPSYQTDEFYPKSILKYTTVKHTSPRHPSEKPHDLLVYLIQTYSKPNDMILDVTFGSASTAIAALNCGRNFVGMELKDEYYKLGCDRMDAYLNKQ